MDNKPKIVPATLGPEPWNPANLPEKKIFFVSE